MTTMPMSHTVQFDCCVNECKVELQKRKTPDGEDTLVTVTKVTLTIEGHDPRIGSYIAKDNVTATLKSKDDLNF